jgi:hypothetical protein
MTSDSAQHSQVSTVSPTETAVDFHVQVRLKSEGERLLLILPRKQKCLVRLVGLIYGSS